MIEVLDVLALERLYLRLDERVQFGELVRISLGNSKSTAAPPTEDFFNCRQTRTLHHDHRQQSP
jgi:hypothetical protein